MKYDEDKVKVLYQRDILEVVFGLYLEGRETSLDAIATKYNLTVRSDEDGDRFVSVEVDEFVFQLLELKGVVELGTILAKFEGDEIVGYYRLPEPEEYEAYKKN